MALLESIGRQLRARRKARRLTLKALASASGLSERFLGTLEAGRANISVKNLAEVAQVLELPLARLFEEASPAAAPRDGVISLLGLRGAGKSTVGKALARRLGAPFFELDRLVEAEAGMDLDELFSLHGESYFRQLELKVLRRFLDDHPRAVLATGGGIVTSQDTLSLLLASTRSVWLRASPEEHWSRVVTQGDLRPMRNRPQAMTELKRRLKEREPLYARAEHTLGTSGLEVEQVVDELERWGRGAPAKVRG